MVTELLYDKMIELGLQKLPVPMAVSLSISCSTFSGSNTPASVLPSPVITVYINITLTIFYLSVPSTIEVTITSRVTWSCTTTLSI